MKDLPFAVKLLFIPGALIALFFLALLVLFILPRLHIPSGGLDVKRDFRSQPLTAIVTPVDLQAKLIGLTGANLQMLLQEEGFTCSLNRTLPNCATREESFPCPHTYSVETGLVQDGRVNSVRAEKTSNCS